MTDVEIVNPVPVEQAAGWQATMSTTFFGDPHHEHFGRRVERQRRRWLPERTWGARDGDSWVATLATHRRVLTVPGADGVTAELGADALTAVTVNATHRRRGLLTRMLTDSLDAAKRRGDAVSILIAAEWPIYGRFGYAPATRDANYSYLPRHPNAKLAPSGRGRLRQVEPDEAAKLGADAFDRARRLRPGQVDRPALWWTYQFNLDESIAVPEGATPNYVVHEDADGVSDGLVGWRPLRDFDLAGNLAQLEVTDLIAASEDAYRDLWSYLSGIDGVGEILLTDRPVDEPVRWLLTDGRALRQTYAGDHLWLRLLDVPAALAARSYAVPGRLVLEIDDDPLGHADGRFALDGGPDGARCAPTSDPADLRLSHRALAGAYLGGFSLHELAIAGGVTELTPGAMARADVMFAVPLAPWNATGF